MPIAGTSDGRLLGVSGDQETPNSTRLLELDPDTGMIFGTTPVPETDIGAFGVYFALAFYAGDLFTFGLTNDIQTVVHRYDWDDDDGNGEHELTQLEGIEPLPFPGGIIAAASPTCIPLTPAG